MEPMCYSNIKKYSKTISSYYWKNDSVIGRILRVISTIRFYLILCIVKQHKRHVLQVVGNGSHIKMLATHHVKSTQYTING